MTKKNKKILSLGSEGFSKSYWDSNYSEPDEMDGMINAPQHAQYIKSFFDVDYIDISSVIDFGFGLGRLFEETLKVFRPYKVYGLEPSPYAFEEVVKRNISPTQSSKFKLENIDLLTWAQKSKPKSPHFDLGICTSVFQYLTDEEIKLALPIMASRVKYLYFSVPTSIELERQISDMEFRDEYAIHRKRQKYLQFLKPHFTVIGNRFLESKVFFSEKDTFFTDLLFRF